jgi:transposase
MAPGSPFGPGVAALAIYLHTRQMVSYSRLTEMFKGLFGLEISEGAIANIFSGRIRRSPPKRSASTQQRAPRP